MCHGVGIWNDSSDTARSSFMVHNFGFVLVMLAMHRLLIGRYFGMLGLHVVSDVVWLASEEFHFKVFRVEKGSELSLHLFFVKNHFAQSIVKGDSVFI